LDNAEREGREVKKLPKLSDDKNWDIVVYYVCSFVMCYYVYACMQQKESTEIA
jgi:hypothetical protein